MAFSSLDPNSRFEKSLGLLTTRFVHLLQEAEGGVLDLKVVGSSLVVVFYSCWFVCMGRKDEVTC
jgi:hypothetical protein